MAEISHRHKLPLIASGQAQKEVTHNEAVDRIDTLLHLSVKSLSATSPPATPVPGSAWIVGEAATDGWSGRDGEIASYGDSGWRFQMPVAGCLAWVEDIGVFAVRTADAWLWDAWPAKAIGVGESKILAETRPAIALAPGGTTIDFEARAAIMEVLAVLRFMGLIAG